MKTLAALAAVILAAACGAAKTTPASCTSFTDLTADATPTVDFGGMLGNAYVPRCAMVKLAQSVTFQGDFGIHPISQTSGPAAIPHTTSGSTPLVVTFPSAATYEYQCDAHHAAGMTGAIQVVP